MGQISRDGAAPGLRAASTEPEPVPEVRIPLAEDKDVHRNGLLVLLSQIAGAQVVGTAVDREELTHRSAELLPDILVDAPLPVPPCSSPAVPRKPGGK